MATAPGLFVFQEISTHFQYRQKLWHKCNGCSCQVWLWQMWEFVLMQQLFILHLLLKLSSSSPGRNVHDETGKPGKDCLKYCKDPPSIWAMGGDKSDFCHVALLCPQAILKTPWFDESQAIPVLVQSCADVWQCLEGMVETAKPSLIFFFCVYNIDFICTNDHSYHYLIL